MISCLCITCFILFISYVNGISKTNYINYATPGFITNEANIGAYSKNRGKNKLCSLYNYGYNSTKSLECKIDELHQKVISKNKNEPEFLQAFEEVLLCLKPVFKKDIVYLGVLENIAEPERVIQFRVPWINDKGEHKVNRGFRVQYSSVLGPYKGGLRFHPTVNLSVIKFLGFEQIFKNSLTTLPMGGGKGGSDFDPKEKSENEILKFCQSFMTNLFRYIGPNTDVPAGDIGVGGKEIGFMFGQYKKLKNAFEGVLTGKNIKWGGSNIRSEATGYGVVYFAENALKDLNDNLRNKRCVVSGSGNVAQYLVEKLIEKGAIVLTMSDSDGFVLEPSGFTKEQLAHIMNLKNNERKRLKEYLKYSKTAKYFEKQKPWDIPCDIVFPCATQNEISEQDADALIKNKCQMVVEGANMPTHIRAIHKLKQNKIIICPSKAANAGGVAVSGLEMSQNSMRMQWTSEETDKKLQNIMKSIYDQCYNTSKTYMNEPDLVAGANIAGFLKVADSFLEQGGL
ncbi:NADP-specific glutamate dehydrogenase, putative [Plasmodium relictum]|uniref:Glutamate dehydrogenase n=1 Tax=Plasmodium relictum TaxID=85471 RepID=A0A1J1HE75_PLARL|nr:NADP-specific glutamate dehydrogenase, putative [Plasmodium relictum]CRH03845.1 NADP-specific glutamate dehydrogenase, putative [Plasmodium relictum]